MARGFRALVKITIIEKSTHQAGLISRIALGTGREPYHASAGEAEASTGAAKRVT
jgi:hypothetical protein